MVEYSMTNPQHGQTIRQTKNPNQHERKRQQIVRDSFLDSCKLLHEFINKICKNKCMSFLALK